ncbi:hypothetical protein HK102_004450 [Quaeritorhiza haematococci]|nr:hypothetical protein HK102_004450 [Quaeritorhiza haematococci]
MAGDYKMVYVCLAAVVLLAIGVMYSPTRKKQSQPRLMITSTVDNQAYLVQDGLLKQDAADVLAKLRKNLNHIVSRLPDSEVSTRLHTRILRTKMEEEDHEPGLGLSTYTVNKGDSIVFCLKRGSKFYNYQFLMYVALHELAHIASVSVGHNAEFHKNFTWLLNEARKTGLFHGPPPITTPFKYCSTCVNRLVVPVITAWGRVHKKLNGISNHTLNKLAEIYSKTQIDLGDYDSAAGTLDSMIQDSLKLSKPFAQAWLICLHSLILEDIDVQLARSLLSKIKPGDPGRPMLMSRLNQCYHDLQVAAYRDLMNKIAYGRPKKWHVFVSTS